MDNKNSKLKNGLVLFLTVVGDLMSLNLLWLACSLPIITIGPSTCALYDCLLHLANEESFPVLKTFFKSFKANFKQSLIVGALSIFVLVTLYADVNYILAIEGNLQKLFIVIAILVLAMLLIIATYGYALIAKYNNTLKGHIINAFKLAFVNPLQTIIMWFVLLIPVFLFLFVQPIILIYIGWFFILFLVSLPVYLCCRILVLIFKKFDMRSGI